MAANVEVQAESALGGAAKVASLTEEVVRRLRHTSLDLDSACRMEALEILSQKIINSGHRNTFRGGILIKSIVKFDNCISRIYFQEGTVERKIREIREAEDSTTQYPKWLTIIFCQLC